MNDLLVWVSDDEIVNLGNVTHVKFSERVAEIHLVDGTSVKIWDDNTKRLQGYLRQTFHTQKAKVYLSHVMAKDPRAI